MALNLTFNNKKTIQGGLYLAGYGFVALDIYRFSCINKTIKKVVLTELQGEKHQRHPRHNINFWIIKPTSNYKNGKLII